MFFVFLITYSCSLELPCEGGRTPVFFQQQEALIVDVVLHNKAFMKSTHIRGFKSQESFLSVRDPTHVDKKIRHLV